MTNLVVLKSRPHNLAIWKAKASPKCIRDINPCTRTRSCQSTYSFLTATWLLSTILASRIDILYISFASEKACSWLIRKTNLEVDCWFFHHLDVKCTGFDEVGKTTRTRHEAQKGNAIHPFYSNIQSNANANLRRDAIPYMIISTWCNTWVFRETATKPLLKLEFEWKLAHN